MLRGDNGQLLHICFLQKHFYMDTGCSLRLEADAFSEGKIWSGAESFSDREWRNYQWQLLGEDLCVEREIKLQERLRRRQELQAQRKAQRDKAPQTYHIRAMSDLQAGSEA